MPVEFFNRVYCDGCGEEIHFDTTYYPVILRDDTGESCTLYFHDYSHVRDWVDSKIGPHDIKVAAARENSVVQLAEAEAALALEVQERK